MKLSNINNPTSAKMHKIGMGIVAAATSLSATSYATGHENFGIAVAILGAVGLFITNIYE